MHASCPAARFKGVAPSAQHGHHRPFATKHYAPSIAHHPDQACTCAGMSACGTCCGKPWPEQERHNTANRMLASPAQQMWLPDTDRAGPHQWHVLLHTHTQRDTKRSLSKGLTRREGLSHAAGKLYIVAVS
jgi:hypothetical protein